MKKVTSPKKKPLVENAGFWKTIAVMAICHAMVTTLCCTVLFDLFLFGIPLFLCRRSGIISDGVYYKVTSAIINWTTPIVFGFPMIYSGTRVYSNNMDILLESKCQDSLLLSNHGSRIDWMVAMFIGYLTVFGNCIVERCRVGFVCEALIQFMPLIGWYRKIICDDIFVWRSIDRDAPTIKANIQTFHNGSQKRMLFLSPEGVVVDHGENDMEYVRQCQQFAVANEIKPLEYVLTPRYKGTSCLLDQISSGGPLVSICLAFVRNGKLMNCKLLSADRIVPDIYDLNQGILGSPISIFMHLRKVKVDANVPFDAKSILLAEYEWKDSILREWDNRLSKGDESWKHKFDLIQSRKQGVLLNHFAHAFVMFGTAYLFGCHGLFMKAIIGVFCCITIIHTLGYMVNETSMESVPFETGIKAFIKLLSSGESASECKKN